MATGVDKTQIDRAQESALLCARTASGDTDMQRRTNCELCCFSEYGLKGLYRAPRTPWSEGMLEACLQMCPVASNLQETQTVTQQQQTPRWEQGSWAHEGAETFIGNQFLRWPVSNGCVVRQYDTARIQRPTVGAVPRHVSG